MHRYKTVTLLYIRINLTQYSVWSPLSNRAQAILHDVPSEAAIKAASQGHAADMLLGVVGGLTHETYGPVFYNLSLTALDLYPVTYCCAQSVL